VRNTSVRHPRVSARSNHRTDNTLPNDLVQVYSLAVISDDVTIWLF